MGRYVTEERRTPGFEAGQLTLAYFYRGAFQKALDYFPKVVSGSYYFPLPYQRTYSFRTGVRAGEGGELDQLLDRARTAGAVVQGLKTLDALSSSEYDQGHEFDTVRTWYGFSHTDWSGTGGGYTWRGVISPEMYHTAVPNLQPISEQSSLSARGQVAIRDTIPNSSPADLAQALIELKREGLPRILGVQAFRGRFRPKDLAEEYLNLEFGIKPVLRDLQDVSTAILDSREILDRWVDEAGQKLHRQRHFPPETGATRTDGTGRLSRHPTISVRSCFQNQSLGNLTSTLEWSVSDYFKGAYSYYIDEDQLEGLVGFAEQAEYLLGLELTPETLWEVTPWSWLVDWVTNIGVNISNAVALGDDGLVLRYGYMMRKTRASFTRRLSGLRLTNGEEMAPVTASYSFERKQRIRATPYGFDLDLGTLSPKQWSILTALGMTRGNRSLRLND